MKNDLVARGQKFYDEHLKEKLESKHAGRYVAIEPETGRYFLDDTGTGALVRARKEMPGGLFYLVRVGYQTADAIGGYASRIR
jgi:hypothetical protein